MHYLKKMIQQLFYWFKALITFQAKVIWGIKRFVRQWFNVYRFMYHQNIISFFFSLRKKIIFGNTLAKHELHTISFVFFFWIEACVKMINHVVLSKKGLDLLKCPWICVYSVVSLCDSCSCYRCCKISSSCIVYQYGGVHSIYSKQ